MTSSFVPPTQPSQPSHLHQIHLNPDSHLSHPSSSVPATASPSSRPYIHHDSLDPFPTQPSQPHLPPPRRTIVLDPPPLPCLPDQNPIAHVSLQHACLATASATTLTIFRLHVTACNHPTPPATLLAQWPCPRDHAIAAISLSPDASVIAVIIHRSRNTAAVVLLRVHNCVRLIRIALPPLFSYGAQRHPYHAPLSFISSSTTTVASATPPLDALPSRLRRVFVDQVGDVGASSAPPPSEHPAPFALVVSSNAVSRHALLIAFRPGYRRIHHQTHLPLPDTTDRAVLHTVLHLSGARTTSLALVTSRLAFRLVHTSFDSVVANADVPIHSLLGIINARVVLTLCRRASGLLALVVVDEPHVTITSTPFRSSDVVKSALLPLSGCEAVFVVVAADGFPHVVANVALTSRSRTAAVRLLDAPEMRHDLQNGGCGGGACGTTEGWPCGGNAPVAISKIGNLIVAAYAHGRHVVVRFTELDELN